MVNLNFKGPDDEEEVIEGNNEPCPDDDPGNQIESQTNDGSFSYGD